MELFVPLYELRNPRRILLRRLDRNSDRSQPDHYLRIIFQRVTIVGQLHMRIDWPLRLCAKGCQQNEAQAKGALSGPNPQNKIPTERFN